MISTLYNCTRFNLKPDSAGVTEWRPSPLKWFWIGLHSTSRRPSPRFPECSSASVRRGSCVPCSRTACPFTQKTGEADDYGNRATLPFQQPRGETTKPRRVVVPDWQTSIRDINILRARASHPEASARMSRCDRICRPQNHKEALDECAHHRARGREVSSGVPSPQTGPSQVIRHPMICSNVHNTYRRHSTIDYSASIDDRTDNRRKGNRISTVQRPTGSESVPTPLKKRPVNREQPRPIMLPDNWYQDFLQSMDFMGKSHLPTESCIAAEVCSAECAR